MKKIVLVALFIGAFVSENTVNAQLKVSASGNVGIQNSGIPSSALSIGTDGESSKKVSVQGSDIGIYSNRTGSTSLSWIHSIYGTNDVASGKWNVGIRANSSYGSALNSGRSFGLLGTSGNSTSGYNYGVFGTISGNQDGAGIVGTSGYNLDVYIEGQYAGYFDGDVYVTGTVEAQNISLSDMRLKQNISALDGFKALNGILSLNPVEYNLKQRFITPKGDSTTVGTPYYDEKSQLFQKKHFGLIAQELKEIYPDLVYESSDGYLAVDYTGIIPLLIQSVKELKAQVETLSSSSSLRSAELIQPDPSVTSGSLNLKSILYQNTPNPFSTSTSIKYVLSDDVATASILIFDMQGKLLRTIPINKKGEGSIIIEGSTLTPGMCIYSLIANSSEVDTKRMILTE